MDTILIRGARTHNLKNIDLDLPRDKFIVITGLSGSGKSSLAFDTIYAEGQRRYVESLSAYARQFLSVMQKPDVDHIEGLSPAISIEQKSTSHNPRSTVGTTTEIYDYLRLLYARVGEPRCPQHGVTLYAQTISQMVDQILALPADSRLLLLAPVVQARKGEHREVFETLRRQGYVRARIDGQMVELDTVPALELYRKHDIEVVVDRFKVRPDSGQRLAESLELAVRLGEGVARVAFHEDPGRAELVFSSKFACTHCGYSLPELEPRLFSLNNPAGACETCGGLGHIPFVDPERVLHQPGLSLAAGAIRGWDRRNVYYLQIITALAEHYKFGLDTPFKALPKSTRQAILYGSGTEPIAFDYPDSSGKSQRRKHAFEGVLNNIERRYRETESSLVRDDLAKFIGTKVCEACGGARLGPAARHVFVADRSLPELVRLPVGELLTLCTDLRLPGSRGEIAAKISKEITERLRFLVNVGLDYLALDRSADTLSGGEAQRIRLASQIGAGLVGIMYILDEPSIGLHQRDNQRLLDTLLHLRDQGNTVIVVEHDEEAIRAADWVVDMGPGAGTHGGQVVFQGTPKVLTVADSLTGQYLSGRRTIPVPPRAVIDEQRVISLRGAAGNNLKNISVDIPIGVMTCVTGVSGSGKSTLVNDTLYAMAARQINKAGTEAKPCREILGLEHFDKVVDIDQSPIGRTPRSNPATYSGLFTPLRDLFATTPEARTRGYQAGRFSFNVQGGRCEACKGDGMLKVEMHFLPDVYVPCDICQGKRYNRETLEVTYKGYNIAAVLDLTVEEARVLFDPIPVLAGKLQTLLDVGLSYLRLSQTATTLSGGEAQRIKLARELSRRATGSTLYILDEPTTGLHFQDIELLLQVLQKLRDGGNTIVVIEHNLDVIKTADWIIDLGPEGGAGGGEVLAVGPPETIAACSRSYTGRYLAPLLKPGKTAGVKRRSTPLRSKKSAKDI
jgi:excinuclease ABC subunit A